MFLKLVVLIVGTLVGIINSSAINNEQVKSLGPDVYEPHHLIVGTRQFGDKPIYEENISEKFNWMGQKIVLNRTAQAPANHVITQVVCLDQAGDGTGAEAVLTGGGPGFNWVNLKFKSQRWHGIYFSVQVFAKPQY